MFYGQEVILGKPVVLEQLVQAIELVLPVLVTLGKLVTLEQLVHAIQPLCAKADGTSIVSNESKNLLLRKKFTFTTFLLNLGFIYFFLMLLVFIIL